MKNDFPTEVLCEAFCVSRSGFYDWLERNSNPSARAKEEVKLAEQEILSKVVYREQAHPR